MLPASAHRVTEQTAREVNQRIRRETEERIAHLAARPHEIGARLAALDREWDVERTLEANAATLAFAGVVLGTAADRRWLLLPAAVTAFLLQHAIQGWCPPLPVLRRLGFRTRAEIDRERYALKALRGDFDGLPGEGSSGRERAGAALAAAER